MMLPPDELAGLRREIDAVNGELLDLLARRGELVRRLAALAARGQAPAGQDAAREAEMLARLRAENTGPYTGEEVEAVFRALFEASLALKRRAGLGGGRP
jgi:chorismate mutase